MARQGVARTAGKLLVAVAAASLAIALWADGTARAAVTSVTAVSVTDLGKYDGRTYREVKLRVGGTAPGGVYDVPVTLAYPAAGKHHSGVAVVDVVNTVTVVWPTALPAPATRDPVYSARLHLGDEHLFGSGHVYLSVIWDKDALARSGTGVIAARADAFSILRDVAAVARNPMAIPFHVRPASSRSVVAYGFSQTGALVRAFLHEHANRAGALAFDGALYGGARGGCLDPAVGSLASYPCGDGAVSDGASVIAFSSETDAQWFGYGERGQTSDYRLLEIAGTAHLPATVIAFTDAPAQNPAGWQPVVRASLRNLIAWIGGTSPPDSSYIALENDVGELLGRPFREAVRDADRNALGGVRLPHLPTTHNGREIGAPLGTYNGLELAGSHFFILLGGRFTPFGPERLAQLYPSHRVYVQRVKKAVHRLVQRRELLKDDGRAYIDEARRSSVGR